MAPPGASCKADRVKRFAAPSTLGSLVAALALVGAVASAANAGWRSVDRRALEDDEVAVEEPYDHGAPDDPRDMLYRDYRDEPVREAPAGAATQPYWGTMQPYWGTQQPYWGPSRQQRVIRQPGLRTAPLKK